MLPNNIYSNIPKELQPQWSPVKQNQPAQQNQPAPQNLATRDNNNNYIRYVDQNTGAVSWHGANNGYVQESMNTGVINVDTTSGQWVNNNTAQHLNQTYAQISAPAKIDMVVNSTGGADFKISGSEAFLASPRAQSIQTELEKLSSVNYLQNPGTRAEVEQLIQAENDSLAKQATEARERIKQSEDAINKISEYSPELGVELRNTMLSPEEVSLVKSISDGGELAVRDNGVFSKDWLNKYGIKTKEVEGKQVFTITDLIRQARANQMFTNEYNYNLIGNDNKISNDKIKQLQADMDKAIASGAFDRRSTDTMREVKAQAQYLLDTADTVKTASGADLKELISRRNQSKRVIADIMSAGLTKQIAPVFNQDPTVQNMLYDLGNIKGSDRAAAVANLLVSARLKKERVADFGESFGRGMSYFVPDVVSTFKDSPVAGVFGLHSDDEVAYANSVRSITSRSKGADIDAIGNQYDAGFILGSAPSTIVGYAPQILAETAAISLAGPVAGFVGGAARGAVTASKIARPLEVTATAERARAASTALKAGKIGETAHGAALINKLDNVADTLSKAKPVVSAAIDEGVTTAKAVGVATAGSDTADLITTAVYNGLRRAGVGSSTIGSKLSLINSVNGGRALASIPVVGRMIGGKAGDMFARTFSRIGGEVAQGLSWNMYAINNNPAYNSPDDLVANTAMDAGAAFTFSLGGAVLGKSISMAKATRLAHQYNTEYLPAINHTTGGRPNSDIIKEFESVRQSADGGVSAQSFIDNYNKQHTDDPIDISNLTVHSPVRVGDIANLVQSEEYRHLHSMSTKDKYDVLANREGIDLGDVEVQKGILDQILNTELAQARAKEQFNDGVTADATNADPIDPRIVRSNTAVSSDNQAQILDDSATTSQATKYAVDNIVQYYRDGKVNKLDYYTADPTLDIERGNILHTHKIEDMIKGTKKWKITELDKNLKLANNNRGVDMALLSLRHADTLEKLEELAKAKKTPGRRDLSWYKFLQQIGMTDREILYGSRYVARVIGETKARMVKEGIEEQVEFPPIYVPLKRTANEIAEEISPIDSAFDTPVPDEVVERAVADQREAVREAVKPAMQAKITQAISTAPSEVISRSGEDSLGIAFTEGTAPVNKLVREQQFQPRIGETGKGTEQSVYEKGYQESMVAQPISVWAKDDGTYTVLGGHSRTKGLERRIKDGLPVPEAINANIYRGITEQQAMQVSRMSNQTAQSESILDMARSIAGSRKDGVDPVVNKKNLVRGTTYDDYEMLHNILDSDLTYKSEVGLIDQSEILRAARHARTNKIEAEKARGYIKSLVASDKFSPKNAELVFRLAGGKLGSLMMREAQDSLFDMGTMVNVVDLLTQHKAKEGEIRAEKSRIDKVIKGSGGRLTADTINDLKRVSNQLEIEKQDIERLMLNELSKKSVGDTTPVEDTTPEVSSNQESLI